MGAFFIGCYNIAMPTVETKIWLALKARIESMSLGFPVAWPGQLFTPSNEPYLRVAHVVARPAAQLVDSGKPHQRTGRLIVTLVYPLSQKQTYEVYVDLQGQIAKHFADGTKLYKDGVCVSVDEYPQAQDGYEDSGWWNAPVNIAWRCFA